MKRNIASFVMAVLVCAGCASQTRQVKYADGSQETETSTGVLQTMQGYDSEGVGLDGTSYKTTIQNITGDVQMAQVLGASFVNLAMIMAAQNNTNLWPIIASNMTAQARSPYLRPGGNPQQQLVRARMKASPIAKKHRFLFF